MAVFLRGALGLHSPDLGRPSPHLRACRRLDAFAFDHRIAARLDLEHQKSPVPHTGRYSVGDNRIDITLDDGGKSSLWYATKNEWLGLLDVAGLRLEALYAGFAGEPFDDDSREYVFVARR